MQPFMIAQLLGDMATVERRRIDLGRKGKASVDIPVDSTAGSLLVSVSKTGDCAPSSQQLRLVRPNGLPLVATGVGVQIEEHAMGKMFLVDAKGFSVAEGRPGLSRVVTFVVRNLGQSANFRFLATNADGWANGPQPTSATIGRNQSVEVRVLLKVPTDAQAGDDHAIVFTATREDPSSVYNSAVVQVIVLRPDEPEALR